MGLKFSNHEIILHALMKIEKAILTLQERTKVIITYGSSEVKKLFAGYFSLQAYLVPSEKTPGNKVATN